MSTNTKQGLYKLHLVGNVLCVEMNSVWSKGTVKKVLEETQELVDGIKHQQWAAVVDLRNWIMPTFEAFEGFQLIYDWCAENNQTHEATICRFELQKSIIGDVSNYDSEHQFYTQKPEDAEQWLVNKGFTFSLKKWHQAMQQNSL
jgi:hypothetical protein